MEAWLAAARTVSRTHQQMSEVINVIAYRVGQPPYPAVHAGGVPGLGPTHIGVHAAAASWLHLPARVIVLKLVIVVPIRTRPTIATSGDVL